MCFSAAWHELLHSLQAADQGGGHDSFPFWDLSSGHLDFECAGPSGIWSRTASEATSWLATVNKGIAGVVERVLTQV